MPFTQSRRCIAASFAKSGFGYEQVNNRSIHLYLIYIFFISFSKSSNSTNLSTAEVASLRAQLWSLSGELSESVSCANNLQVENTFCYESRYILNRSITGHRFRSRSRKIRTNRSAEREPGGKRWNENSTISRTVSKIINEDWHLN